MIHAVMYYTGAIWWGMVLLVGVGAAIIIADSRRMARRRERERFSDVDQLAATAKQRAARIWSNVPSVDDEHAIDIGAI